MNIELPEVQNLSPEEAETLISQAFMSTMTQEDFDNSVIRDYCIVQCGELRFETEEQAQQSIDKLEEWVYETNQTTLAAEADEPIPHLQIDDFQYHKPIKAVTFQVFANDERGIRLQLALFLDFCKTLEGLTLFDAPILQTLEPVVWKK